VSPVLHYCQSYEPREGVKFYKYQHGGEKSRSLMSCTNQSYLPEEDVRCLLSDFPALYRTFFREFMQLNMSVHENAMKKRAAYMLRETVQDTNAALRHYRQIACNGIR